MTAFELPLGDGRPVEITDFQVDLQASPPEIKEEVIEADNYVLAQPGYWKIDYTDAQIDEGHLNICVCKFRTGKYRLHIFGKIKGKEFSTEKEINNSVNSMGLLNERIKYVLFNSRNVLRKYYLNANLQSIEDHLKAFIVPS